MVNTFFLCVFQWRVFNVLSTACSCPHPSAHTDHRDGHSGDRGDTWDWPSCYHPQDNSQSWGYCHRLVQYYRKIIHNASGALLINCHSLPFQITNFPQNITIIPYDLIMIMIIYYPWYDSCFSEDCVDAQWSSRDLGMYPGSDSTTAEGPLLPGTQDAWQPHPHDVWW